MAESQAYEDIDSYDISEGAKEMLRAVYDNLKSRYSAIMEGIRDDFPLAAVNLGNRSNPHLMLTIGSRQAGEISISEEGLQYAPERNLDLGLETDRDLINNIQKNSKIFSEMTQEAGLPEPDAQDIYDLFDAAPDPAEPQIKPEEKDIAFKHKNKEDHTPCFTVRNEDGSYTALNPKRSVSEQLQERLDRDVEAGLVTRQEKISREAGINNVRHSEKETEFKNSREQIDNKYNQKDATRAARKAEREGASLKDVRKSYKDQINQLHNEIGEIKKQILNEQLKAYEKDPTDPSKPRLLDSQNANLTFMREKLAEKEVLLTQFSNAMPKLSAVLKEETKKAAQGIKDTIEKGFDKIGKACETGMLATKRTFEYFRDSLHKANIKANAHVATAYVGIEEKWAQRYRNCLQIHHAVDKTIEKNLTKIRDAVQKHYEKSANVKNAIKNVGRALFGKKQTLEADLSPKQKETILKLNEKINEHHDRAAQTKSDYQTSLDSSVRNMKSMDKARQDAGLDLSESLEKRCQKAMEQAKKMSQSAPVQSAQTVKKPTVPIQ